MADNTAFRVLQVQNDVVTAFGGTWPQLTTYSSAFFALLLHPSGLCVRQDEAEGLFSITDRVQLTTLRSDATSPEL